MKKLLINKSTKTYHNFVIFARNGKVVEEICTRIDGCRIIDNVCVDSLTQKN